MYQLSYNIFLLFFILFDFVLFCVLLIVKSWMILLKAVCMCVVASLIKWNNNGKIDLHTQKKNNNSDNTNQKKIMREKMIDLNSETFAW